MYYDMFILESIKKLETNTEVLICKDVQDIM